MSYPFQFGGNDHPVRSTLIPVGWKELGRDTEAAGVNALTVSGLADKRYYMVLRDMQDVGGYSTAWTINNDTGNNYAYRSSGNGGAEATGNTQPSIRGGGAGHTTPIFDVGYFSNYSTKEKLYMGHVVGQSTAGAGTAPSRDERTGKWANTANAINRFDSYFVDDGWGQGKGEMVVLGWDPLDEGTTNFWVELASVNASGASTNLSSGTITAKKYLWVQAWLKNTTSHTTGMTFNNDTTTYSYRLSDNGGADSTQVTQADISLYSAVTTPIFVNMFIQNISANNKLVIGHTISQSTAGAGTASNRREFVGKYDNTAAQITEIDLDSSAGNWDSSSIIKVWGSN